MPSQPKADAIVLFGATGDLAKRKLFPALYHIVGHEGIDLPIIGVARSDWTDAEFHQHATDAVTSAAGTSLNAVLLDALLDGLHLVTGDYSVLSTFEALRGVLDQLGSQHAVFYLAIPPAMFPKVVQSLRAVGLHDRGRVVVEKPFGRDLASAQELNSTLHDVFPEERIFRIDHYLGKESVEDLLVFRFSNSLLEPIWNRNHVGQIQITMSETIGVEGRGSFYDSVGTIRDFLQNHLLQVLALLTMEPPVGPDATYLHDEKGKVFAAMPALDCEHLVRGQYAGYLAEEGVAAGSTVETYVAAKFTIDSWRWAGVPIYVRCGKGLVANASECIVELKPPPRMLFDESPDGKSPNANLIRFRLGKNDGVTFTVQAKQPGPFIDSQDVDLRCDFSASLGERHEAYERLLQDAIMGSSRRFARQDVVEQTWRIVQPALLDPGPVFTYERGSWGPAEADDLVPGGWIPTSS
jgi:glucose-6-phosphate 1-dehydrogenase